MPAVPQFMRGAAAAWLICAAAAIRTGAVPSDLSVWAAALPYHHLRCGPQPGCPVREPLEQPSVAEVEDPLGAAAAAGIDAPREVPERLAHQPPIHPQVVRRVGGCEGWDSKARPSAAR